MQLPFRAAFARPMQQFATGMSGVVREDASCCIPWSQFSITGCLSSSNVGWCRPLLVCFTTHFGQLAFVRLALQHALATPTCNQGTSTQDLMWCSCILAAVPVLGNLRRHSGQAVMQADISVQTIWALTASGPGFDYG